MRNRLASRVVRPGAAAASFTDKSAMFRVPAVPYTIPRALTNKMDDTMLMTTYLRPPSSCPRSPPRVIRPKELISITSKNTYRLNKSPVTKEPQTPISKNW